VSGVLEGDGLRLRRASSDDVDFLLALVTHGDVEPFLAGGSPRTREELLAELERQEEDSREFGRFVIEVDDDGAWRRAGAFGFQVKNRRSRIAQLAQLAVHPDFRGRRISDTAAQLMQRYLLFDLGYHRLELEIYGFNERALHHAERSGFVREGVKRKAYWRHGRWTDGVLYGLIREDVEG
jgi:RimJ/RimL family protein N-acetyltransferase